MLEIWTFMGYILAITNFLTQFTHVFRLFSLVKTVLKIWSPICEKISTKLLKKNYESVHNLWQILRKKSRIRETPMLSTDADSRTNIILERVHDLLIRTKMQTWSTRKCGLGSR